MSVKMKYITGTDFKLHNTAVSLGKFEGLHIGHRLLLDRIVSLKEKGYESVVFTFNLNPHNLFAEKDYQLIYTDVEKRKYLKKMGIDSVIAYPFTEKTACMEPEDFISNILVGQLDVKVIVVGSDFAFGHKRKGNVALLKEMSEIYGYELIVFEKVKLKDTVVSSSQIRVEISKGNMEVVQEMLGQPYMIAGEVIHGNQIGRTLSMPTINILPDSSKLLPPNGVYVSTTLIDGRHYQGVTNIGYKPTVAGGEKKGVETYIFDFEGDLYGRTLEVYLYNYQRSEEKFPSLEALKIQLKQDEIYGRQYFKNQNKD